MQTARRPLRRAYLLLGLIVALVLPVAGAEKSRVKAEDYVIDAEIIPRTHHLTARAKELQIPFRPERFAYAAQWCLRAGRRR